MPKKEKELPEQVSAEPSIAEVEEIQDLAGVGDVTAGKLLEGGYDTIEMLAITPPERLQELGIELSAAKKIISSAITQVERVGIKYTTALELLNQQQRIFCLSSRVPSLDAMLGGRGFEARAITIAHGEPSVGKSQLSMWLCACALTDRALKDASVIYIDTENTFRADRVLNFLKVLGGTEQDLKRIIYAEAYNSKHQKLLIDHCGKQVKDGNVKLLILDSLTAHFRAEFTGREMLNPRQQQLNDHLAKIQKLARIFDLVAFVTTQEVALPAQAFMGAATSKGAGGFVVMHRAMDIIQIWKPDGMTEKRFLTLEKHPSEPQQKIILRLNEQGFSDFDSAKKKPEEIIPELKASD